jgi:hypothetical protein
MSATGPTRIEVAEFLVHHSALHQERFWEELSKLPELAGKPPEETLERGLLWNFEFKHAIEDLRSALEYGPSTPTNSSPARTISWGACIRTLASPSQILRLRSRKD